MNEHAALRPVVRLVAFSGGRFDEASHFERRGHSRCAFRAWSRRALATLALV